MSLVLKIPRLLLELIELSRSDRRIQVWDWELTQYVGDVTWWVQRSITVQLYLRTWRLAELRNLYSQPCILEMLIIVILRKLSNSCLVFVYKFGQLKANKLSKCLNKRSRLSWVTSLWAITGGETSFRKLKCYRIDISFLWHLFIKLWSRQLFLIFKN